MGTNEFAWANALNQTDTDDKEFGAKDSLVLVEQITLYCTWNWLHLVLWIAFTRKDSIRDSDAASRADTEAFKATIRMGEGATACLRDGILDLVSRLVRDHIASFIVWIIRVSYRTIRRYKHSKRYRLNRMCSYTTLPKRLWNHQTFRIVPEGSILITSKRNYVRLLLRSIEAVRVICISADSNKLADVLHDMVRRASVSSRHARPPLQTIARATSTSNNV